MTRRPVATAFVSLLAALAPGSVPADGPPVTWQEDIQPIIREHCLKCHGGAEQKAGLDLRSLDSARRGSKDGVVLVDGSRTQSPLFELISPGADPQMPPKGERLSAEEIALIGRWIDGGMIGARSSVDEPAGLPEGIRPRLAIDLAMENRWAGDEIAPAARCNDEIFLRRVYLDLIGRIPTGNEAGAFSSEVDSGKRDALVDRLLESDEHARHFAEIMDVVLLGRSIDSSGRASSSRGPAWRAYLEWAFRSNRPWDEMVRDLVLARPGSSEARGAAWFLYEQRNDHEAMAKAFAPILLGKQVQCAQCHDHPVVQEIEQRHYWGLVAFFNRTFNVKTPNGPGLGESAVGGHIQYSNLKGDAFDAKLTFFNGVTVDEEARPVAGEERHDADLYEVPPPKELLEPATKKEGDEKKRRRGRREEPEVDLPPIPKDSRRERLLEVTIHGNPEFPKAIINRLWAHCFGRGLVHPVDHLDSVHPPSHPELFEWLARDFAGNGYDMRRLLREMVLSRIYQVDSVPVEDGTESKTFAFFLTKPLVAEALGRSFLVALGYGPDEGGRFQGIDENAWLGELVMCYPDVFPDTYSPLVKEGLFFSNHAAVQSLLDWEKAPLLWDLAAVPDRVEAVEKAFRRILGRLPDDAEREASLAFLEERADRLNEEFSQLVWALLCSGEFRVNH